MGSSRDSDFDEWVLHNRIRLHKTAFLLCGDWYLADDLVQEALIKCFPKWKRITNNGDPTPYLRTTLVRLCVDHSRRPSRREVADSPVEDRYPSVGGVPGSDHLLTALQSIPPGQRAVLVLRYWDGLTIDQTAKSLRTSTGNVKSQSSRGMRALRSALVISPENEEV